MKYISHRCSQGALVALMVIFTFHAAAKPRKQHTRKSTTRKSLVTPTLLRGKIIFQRGSDVWMVDPATRCEQMIFKNPFWEGPRAPFSPAITFSPDLKRVAFTREPRNSTGSELHIMNLDRSSKKRLTDTGAKDYVVDPRFSPDGRQIVYTRRSGYRWGGPGYTGMEIRLVNSDGANDHRVIGDINDLGQSYFGAFWSRDGKRLLFTHYIGNIDYDGEGGNKQELQTCLLDGSDVQPFDGNYGAFLYPDVSPDGKLRAVVEPFSPQYLSYPVLRLQASQGGFVRDLVLIRDLYEGNPRWSSDGKSIAFQGDQVHTQVDKAGRPREVHLKGVWTVGSDRRYLRRIASDALLIAWLH